MQKVIELKLSSCPDKEAAMYVSLIVTFLLILGITIFALQNDTLIAIKFFIWEYTYTQVAVILGSALVGAAIMAVMTWPHMIKKHFKARKFARQICDLEKKNQDLENQLIAQGKMSAPGITSQGEHVEAASGFPHSETPA